VRERRIRDLELLRRAAREHGERVPACIELLLKRGHGRLEGGERIALLLDLQLGRDARLLLREQQLQNARGVVGDGVGEREPLAQALHLKIRIDDRRGQRQRDRIAVEFRRPREQRRRVRIGCVEAPEVDFVAGFRVQALASGVTAAVPPAMLAVVGAAHAQRRILRRARFLGGAARLLDRCHRRGQRIIVAQTPFHQHVERWIAIGAPPAAFDRHGRVERRRDCGT
jgi:hypothetical protein